VGSGYCQEIIDVIMLKWTDRKLIHLNIVIFFFGGGGGVGGTL
jgi:hypothetical protein